MPAPNDHTVLNFETHFENAAEIFLATGTDLSTNSIFKTLDQDTFVVPRLEVLFEVGEANDPPIPKGASLTALEYMEFIGVLSIRIVSDASVDGTQTLHRTIRSKVRASMLRNASNWTTDNGSGGYILPYYDVLYQRPTETTYEIDGDLAVSTLAYQIKFQIRDDAFPTS